LRERDNEKETKNDLGMFQINRFMKTNMISANRERREKKERWVSFFFLLRGNNGV